MRAELGRIGMSGEKTKTTSVDLAEENARLTKEIDLLKKSVLEKNKGTTLMRLSKGATGAVEKIRLKLGVETPELVLEKALSILLTCLDEKNKGMSVAFVKVEDSLIVGGYSRLLLL